MVKGEKVLCSKKTSSYEETTTWQHRKTPNSDNLITYWNKNLVGNWLLYRSRDQMTRWLQNGRTLRVLRDYSGNTNLKTERALYRTHPVVRIVGSASKLIAFNDACVNCATLSQKACDITGLEEKSLVISIGEEITKGITYIEKVTYMAERYFKAQSQRLEQMKILWRNCCAIQAFLFSIWK